jgi:hypothetical protein
MLKLAAVVVGLAIAAALAWNAGEMHRENCIHSGHVKCSVLPWENGKPKHKPSFKDLGGDGVGDPGVGH